MIKIIITFEVVFILIVREKSNWIFYLFNNRNQNQNIQDLADSRFQSKVISYASMIDEIYKSAQLKDIIFGENGIGFQKQDNYSITNTTLLKKNNVELVWHFQNSN